MSTVYTTQSTFAKTNVRQKKAFFFPAICAASVGLGTSVTFDFYGVLRVSEVICLVLGIMLFAASAQFRKLFWHPHLRVPISLVLAMVTFQLLSDAYNNRSALDMLKGHANFGFSVAVVSLLAFAFNGRPSVLVVFFMCKAISAFFFRDFLNTSNEILSNEYWDIRIGYWASPLLQGLAILLFRKQRIVLIFLMLAYGAAAVFFGGRSHGMVFVVAAVVLTFASPEMRQRVTSFAIRNRNRWAKIVIAGIVGVSLFFPTYVYFGLQGVITEKAETQLRSLKQPYNPFEVLLAGRGGITIGANALTKKPILGYGSRNYSGDYLDGFIGASAFRSREYNYVHSMIFESFTYGGLTVGLLYVLLLASFLKRCAEMGSVRDYGCTMLIAIAATSFAWASLASPLASFRLIWPIVLASTFAFQSEFLALHQKK